MNRSLSFFNATVLALAIGGGALPSTSHAQPPRVTAELVECKKTVDKLSVSTPMANKDSATIANVMRLQQARIDSANTMAQSCIAKIDGASVPDSMLTSLFDLQRRAKRFDQATATAVRMARVATEPPAQRLRNLEISIMGLPTTPAILALTREAVRLADSTGHVQSQMSARVRVAMTARALAPFTAYQAAQQALDFVEHLPPADRPQTQSDVASLVFHLAQWSAADSNAMYAAGFAARASALLGPAPEFLQQVSFDLRRVSVIDTKAIPFESKYWVNMPAGSNRRDMADGKVRLVEFTSEWCAGCKLTYRPIQALYKELAPQGFEPIFCVPNEGEANKLVSKYQDFFSHYGVEFPIVVDLAGQAHKHYTVASIPHFLIVDRRGVVRDVFLGWDANRATKLIKQLLAEQ